MDSEKTLRLLFPQWQGGDNPSYMFGARLLAWLAPEAEGPVEEVAVAEPNGQALQIEGGILARGAVLEQARDARAKIDRHQPDRILVLGGDCGVDLAPFSYLSERYDGDLAVIWIDTHSDLFSNELNQMRTPMFCAPSWEKAIRNSFRRLKRRSRPAMQ